MKKQKLMCMALISSMSVFSAQADIWCKKGTIVQIGDVSWGAAAIEANFPGTIPGSVPAWVTDLDVYVATTAMFTYASSFAGGGGGFGGYSVPDSGSITTDIYAPFSLTNMVGAYSYSEGIQFKIFKCYTIPPMTSADVLEEVQINDGVIGGGIIKPLRGLDRIREYWTQREQ